MKQRSRYDPDVLAYMVGFLASQLARHTKQTSDDLKEFAYKHALADLPTATRRVMTLSDLPKLLAPVPPISTEKG